jgi:hypothetical protein
MLYLCKERRQRRGRYMRRTGNYVASRSYVTAVARDEALIIHRMWVAINIDQKWRRHKMRSCLSLEQNKGLIIYVE